MTALDLLGPGTGRRLALGLLLASFIPACPGCKKAASRAPAAPSEDDLKELISRAASISVRQFHVLATAGMTPRHLSAQPSQPLTLAVLTPMSGGPDLAEEDLRLLGPPGLGRTDRFAEAICPGVEISTDRPPPADTDQYASIIRPEYITACESRLDEGRLTGTVRFRADDLYEGTVEFTALWKQDAWRVVEFRFPVSGHRTALTELGTWVSTLRALPERKLDIKLPKAATQPAPLSAAPRHLIINIRRDGQVVVAGRLCDEGRLRKILAAAAREDPQREVLIRCDGKTPHEHVARVLATCTQAGIQQTRIGLVTPRPTSQPSPPRDD